MTAPSPEFWSAVNELFAELAEQEPSARRRRLASFPGDDPVRKEVESLLAALDSDRVNLEPSPGASHLTLGGEPAVLLVSLSGRRLGPWAVMREVGRGGMGAVYEAFRADDQYRKRVAVKTLTRGAGSELVARRFQMERQILATLEHPGIATLIDGGVTEEGLPYLVMEFVDGQPIDRFCAERKLSLRERLDLFREVCAAVHFAHRNLVVHRDLKPSNVLVTAEGGIKLVDFGIAKLLGGGPGGDPTLTETGQRAFTTAYASPEQVRGTTISTSSDVYSLGAMLYLLLAGRLPFEVARLTPADAFRTICDDPPPPPSKVATDTAALSMGLPNRERLARELRGELDDIVLAALRKEPERRYATVSAFADDLKRFLQGQQVSARPDTWRYRVRAFTRRNPKLVSLTGVAAASLLLGAGIAAWQAHQAGVERDRARAEATRSSRVVSFIEQTLAGPTQGALTQATIELLDQTVTRAAQELADDPLARAAVYRTAANAFSSHNHDARALLLLDSALTLDRSYAGARSTEMGRDLIIAARLAYSRGLLDSAVAYAGDAVRLLKAFPSDRPVDLPMALLYSSFALSYAGQPAEGLRVAEEGIVAAARQRPPTVAPYMRMAHGEALVFQGDLRGGVRDYRTSIAMYDSLPVRDPPERGIAELGAASLLFTFDSVEAALPHIQAALDVLQRRWGDDHAYTGRARALAARIALARKDSAEARRQLAGALRVLDSGLLGLLDAVTIEVEVAYYHFLAGQPDSAVARLRDVLARDSAKLALAPVEQANTLTAVGDFLMQLKRVDEAVPPFTQAYQLRVRAYGPRHRFTVNTAARLLILGAARDDSALVARYSPLFTADTAAMLVARGKTLRASRP